MRGVVERGGRVMLLSLALLIAGCATVPPAPATRHGGRTPEQVAADRAACEAEARQAEDSRVLRSALGTGALMGGLVMLYGAAEGALWGAISGGGRADGAWIGAAAGAGVGFIIGTVAGVHKAREARTRFLGAVETCMDDRARLPAPAPPPESAS